MNLELISFQQEIKTMLINARDKNRLSHAYIFQGPKGVGKKDMALFFSQMLYCTEKEPCQSCQNCVQIEKKEHLNIVIIQPESKVIRKEQIVNLHQEFSKTSQVVGPRVYIIIDADKMNQQSQNSLLKFIEEPEEGIYGILCTTNISQLLPTITSRCQTINFISLDETILEKELLNEGLEKNYANIASYLTNDKEEALSMAKEDIFTKLITVFEKFLTLKTKKDAVLFHVNNQSFFESPTNLIRFMNLLIIIYEDILSLYTGSTKVRLHSYIENLNKYKNRLTKEDALKHLEFIYELNKKSNYNVSYKNIYTNLFVNLF